MRTKLYFVAALAATMLASCADDKFVGDNSPNELQENAGVGINFGLEMPNITRGNIAGKAAADLLGNIFYVTGTKGTEGEKNPSPTLVFDNYLVHYGVNTAGTTESNTANWDYVGITPGSAPYGNWVKLSSLDRQTIKYWDYSAAQYDFLAFSTGNGMKAVKYSDINLTSIKSDEIGVEAMKYGTGLSVASGTKDAYKFFIPSVAALEKTFITDITEVSPANYGKEVTLKFKNLGSKVRVALYETVPGYSVKDVIFYTVDGESDFSADTNKDEGAKLISANTNGLPTNGTITIQFPHVGTYYQPGATNAAQDYDKATAIVESPASNATYDKYKVFDALTAQLIGREGNEANSNVYLGRTLPQATFAGSAAANFYKTVFPVSTSDPITLRVDYTLVPIDGAAETIKVYGAKAVVPSKFTQWLPNYAYTYIFKITDNTNGWTTETVSGTTPAGLFPITFDAVVTEATDATGEQKTITTVAAPSITTYQQNHDITQNEYLKNTGKNLYVQVMKDGSLVGDLNHKNGSDEYDKSFLYLVDKTNATEAEVMDALEKRRTTLDVDPVKGRNNITLTKSSYINNAVTQIVNGPDNNPIGVNAGQAAQIAIGSLSAGTYAYVYDYTDGAKTSITEYQPITVGNAGSVIGTTGETFYYIEHTDIAAATVTDPDEVVNNTYLYFSVTTNGTGTPTYSYVSVTGKKTLPAGLKKVLKSSITSNTVTGGTDTVVDGRMYFDTYITNNGLYAVKVIKVVE